MYVLDTCVLFPTVVRNILLKLALSGKFKPVWSKKHYGRMDVVQ